VALPAYLAARRRHIPIVVHEANARAGIANRLGARLTRNVFTASAEVRLAHGQPIGIPMRPAITTLDRAGARAAARAEFGLDQQAPVLLVTGGSQGAQSINAVIAASRAMLRAIGVQVLHIVGPANAVDDNPEDEQVDAGGGPRAAEAKYVAVPFVADMQQAYAAADFAVCRSGAMTCAELSAVGLPAVYVPLPLRGGEQRLNAEPIVRAGGGLLVDNERFTPEWVEENLLPCLLDPDRISRMAAAAARAGARDADVRLARRVLEIATAHRAGLSR
jgi:UDP-N-acetylglucosamine--N-acetylmuramyl-(pentapeptide) pyrophosphoryl-undecaprenol N-acetylglucosamine transferase